MPAILLCFLGTILAVGVHGAGPSSSDNIKFSSNFLKKDENAKHLLDLMKGHFSNSLDYLISGKYYDSQDVEFPGMAKLLVEESDRQWEEGMSVLKKYLHLGGTTDGSNFIDSMNFIGTFQQNNAVDVNYKDSLKTVMTKSHHLTREITKLHVKANQNPSNNGDTAVLHFLQEKAEKEIEVARKMAGLYVMVKDMFSDGIALGIFDQSL
ncbi:uncharacterized protein LOC123505123 [Portunus trituberculatus]|uniref:uncharacterized protein LOC123505123 n=1 Tax=Portunus trituberculatus TaxID=210409 RepID=UPI001E1CD088|nr:uncharacterized protein LOC123505123 [Portunus trituberculatus]XP_045112139.1 uncharacterized protein LOC123505123 [Portunus trituberculatus]XP_045112140.1 uncharacterized protein LOC123505123 [Portunus trituberculatus]